MHAANQTILFITAIAVHKVDSIGRRNILQLEVVHGTTTRLVRWADGAGADALAGTARR